MRSVATFHGDGLPRTLLRVFTICWRAVAVPVHALLALLEPVVSIVLGLLAFLGVCMSLAFKLLRPEFPFWTMMAVSLSFVVALLVYHALLRVTSYK